MNEVSKHQTDAGLWRQMLCDGAAIGAVMGLVEICWVYFLPVLFPMRRYELPVSTIGWFASMALVVDILFALCGAVFVSVLASIVRSEIKYICNDVRNLQELYQMASDPAETINVYQTRRQLAESCYQSIQETFGEPIETGVQSLDPRVLEQLKSLGYLDYGRDSNQ